MPVNPVTGQPGLRSEKTASFRKILITDQGALYLPLPRVIDGSESRDPLNTNDLDVLRGGVPMGKRTANSLYAPSVIGRLTADYDVAGTTNTIIKVSAATATEVNRRIGTSGTLTIRGPATSGGSLNSETFSPSSIDTTNGRITVSSELSNAYVSGSILQPSDGSETPLVLQGDPDGVKVTDEDDDNIDVPFPKILIGGIVDAENIDDYSNWDSSIQDWVKQQLNNVGSNNVGLFTFDDEY